MPPARAPVPPLAERRLHVAIADLDAIDTDELLTTLSPEERERSASFRFARDGRRFALRRGWLRHLLARETGIAPDALRFAVGIHGKPHLPAIPHLHFNLAHSAGVALATIGDVPLGCDIEACDPAKADPLVVERLFAPAERALLAPLSGPAWTAAFFDIWVRTEAYVKAIGTGLSTPLQSISFPHISGWRVDRIAAPAGFAAAVAAPCLARASAPVGSSQGS